MPDVRRRASAAVVAVIAATLVIGLTMPTAAAAQDPPGRATFMRALGQVESGGRYTARNRVSGAYGKYQILPSMWRAWARIHLGNANARPTPANQERLARAVITASYRRLGSWPVVAHYWLTGRGERDRRTWSPRARRYVAKVMAAYRRYGGAAGTSAGAGGNGRQASSTATVSDGSAAIAYRGGWSAASYRGYAGGRVRWSGVRGATATFTFTGTQVSWVGPKGPTRGRARIRLDGAVVATVDLRSAIFRPRNRLYTATFAERGRHVLQIEVLATPGRPTVAIDAFLVRR